MPYTPRTKPTTPKKATFSCRAPRQTPEQDEQVDLFSYLRLPSIVKCHPAIPWIHSSLNGVRLTRGVAVIASKSGMKAGVWDVLVPFSANGKGGLYIEMKAGNGRLTKEQREFRDALDAHYEFVICRSWIEAAVEIGTYLSITDKVYWRALK